MVNIQFYSNMETQCNLHALFCCFLLWQRNPYHISSPEPNVQSEELTKLTPPPLMLPISCLLLFCPLPHARLFFLFFFSTPLRNQNTC